MVREIDTNWQKSPGYWRITSSLKMALLDIWVARQVKDTASTE